MGRSASLLVTALGAVVVFAFILLQGRPVDVADGPLGPVACVSYAPYTAAQSPFDPTLVIPREQIARDMAVLARVAGCVRTYATGQG